MSLKQKTEAGFLELIRAAGAYTGQRYRAQENQTTTLVVPCVIAIAIVGDDLVLDRQGGQTGLKRVKFLLAVKDSADKQQGQATNPEDVHAANVEMIRDALQVDDLAAELSGTAAAFTVVSAVPSGPPDPDPEERNLVDWFAWELVACESEI